MAMFTVTKRFHNATLDRTIGDVEMFTRSFPCELNDLDGWRAALAWGDSINDCADLIDYHIVRLTDAKGVSMDLDLALADEAIDRMNRMMDTFVNNSNLRELDTWLPKAA